MSNEPSPEKQTCLNCRYWNMWEGNCILMGLSHNDFAPVHPDTPACKEFQPE